MTKFFYGCFFSLFVSASLLGAERIVSLSPNLTEMIVLLGAEGDLVGRSRACDYPERVKTLPVAGNFGTPAVEPLLALQPTLVVTETLREPEETKKRLAAFGVRVEVLPAESVGDYLANLEKLGRLTGHETEAKSEIDRVQARIDAWRRADRVRALENRPATLILVGLNPPVTAGKRSYLTELLEFAGLHNLAANRAEKYFRCSPEWIVRMQPEVILYPGGAGAELPGWQGVPAVKNGRVITDLDGDLFFRLGPRVFDGVEQLRERLKK